MIGLNLLPLKEKISLQRERLYQFIAISLFIFFLGTVLIGSELFWAKRILSENLPSRNLVLNQNQELIEKIRKINSELMTIEKIQNDHIKITPILVSLAKAPGSNNIQITSFILNKDKKNIEIKGRAKNRDELLNFQESLEKLEFISKIEAPFSNLLKQESIDFIFTAELKL